MQSSFQNMLPYGDVWECTVKGMFAVSCLALQQEVLIAFVILRFTSSHADEEKYNRSITYSPTYPSLEGWGSINY